ncbi:MAG: YmdB family metallophosphoesterase, partial [Hyphomicrobiaceae bacterium]
MKLDHVAFLCCKKGPIAAAGLDDTCDGTCQAGALDRDGGASFGAGGFSVRPLTSAKKACTSMRLLFLGDVVGRAGRKAVLDTLPRLRKKYALDFVIVNAENSAGGFGITEAILEELV